MSQAYEFAGRLKQYQDSILGICVDAGSLSAITPRVWVVFRNGIKESLWTEALDSTRRTGVAIFSQFPVYMFDESALEVLLHTSRYWAFEYYHLVNHASLITGENFFTRMHRVPDAFVLRMVLPNIIVKRIALRDVAFNATAQLLYHFICEIVRLKILIDTHTIVTTFSELAAESKGLSGNDEFDSIVALLQHRRIPREELYTRLSAYTHQLQQECCVKMPDQIIEKAVDPA